MSIETYGAEGRTRAAARRLREEISLSSGRHFVLLPIPTTKDKKHIKGTDIPLEETLNTADKDTLIVGYSLPKEYKDSIAALGASVLDLSCDEEFLSENAYLTAIGALAFVLESERAVPKDLRIGIIGYGRIGKELLRLFLFLGASVCVYTTTPTTALKLGESGVYSVCIPKTGGGVCYFSNIDILINTAPTDITRLLGNRGEKDIKIIELASGENFSGVEKVTRLPGIPEKMFPESSGCAYFEAIKRFIQCEVDKN